MRLMSPVTLEARGLPTRMTDCCWREEGVALADARHRPFSSNKFPIAGRECSACHALFRGERATSAAWAHPRLQSRQQTHAREFATAAVRREAAIADCLQSRPP